MFNTKETPLVNINPDLRTIHLPMDLQHRIMRVGTKLLIVVYRLQEVLAHLAHHKLKLGSLRLNQTCLIKHIKTNLRKEDQ